MLTPIRIWLRRNWRKLSERTNYKYHQQITSIDLEDRDHQIEETLRNEYAEDIAHFHRTIDLIMAIFDNATRSHGDQTRFDYVQLLAIRIVQDSRAAMSLALKGMYPQAVNLTRGVLVSTMLIQDFELHPDHEQIWAEGRKQKREALFKDEAIRARLEKSQATGIKDAKPLYGLISQIAVHTNFESFAWYLEFRGEKLYMHWAGQLDKKRSASTIPPIVVGAGIGLMALMGGKFFIFSNKEIVADFLEWKKAHAQLMTKARNQIKAA